MYITVCPWLPLVGVCCDKIALDDKSITSMDYVGLGSKIHHVVLSYVGLNRHCVSRSHLVLGSPIHPQKTTKF